MTTDAGTGRKKKNSSTRNRKPPARWRRYLVQAELDLPPGPARAAGDEPESAVDVGYEREPLPAWQSRPAVFALAVLCLALLVVSGLAVHRASVAREAARLAEQHAETLTLRAYDSEHALRITPNPRSWSAGPDATLAWPEPPQLLQLYLPVGYASYDSYAIIVDKVDQGRVIVIERIARDSNGDLRVSFNSTAFGPGEYRLRLQGYTWRGERVDVGWIRLLVRPPTRD